MIKRQIKMFNVFIYLIIFLGSSCGLIGGGTHGSIKKYEFNYNKAEVNDAISRTLNKASSHRVPDSYQDYTWHYGGDSTIKDEWIQQANADSVSFSFYFPEDNIIIWCIFVGHADNWYGQPCILSLNGYIRPNETKWRFENDMDADEKLMITTKFENLVLSGVNNELKLLSGNQ